MGGRLHRRGPRRDHPRARSTVLRGTVAMVALLLVGMQLLRLYDGVPGRDYATVYVATPIVGNLLPHDAVRVSGKRIGQVMATDIGRDGMPRLELQLEPGTRLPVDTGVRLRANGLLGARFVELVPGKSPQLLGPGATIHGDERSYTYGVPEVLDVFDTSTRAGLRQTVRGLGAGTLGNGTGLNRTLQQAGTYTSRVDAIMRDILRREGAAVRLLPAADAAVGNLSRHTTLVGPWMSAVGDALQPLRTERRSVRATLDRAPGTLAAAERGLARGTELLAALRRLSTAAARTLPPVPGGVRDLATLLRAGRAPLERLMPTFLGQARAGLNAVGELAPILEQLRPRVDQLLRGAPPLLRVVASHSCDVTNAAAVLRSMTGLEQNSESGQLGQAMGFRLQVTAGAPDEVVGAASAQGSNPLRLRRVGYPADCTYISRPYPQFDDLLRAKGKK